jgi:hypothetical protein
MAMNELGLRYGLWFIKQALEETESLRHVWDPNQTGPEQSRKMHDLFLANEHRDPMTAEDMGGSAKVGEMGDFTAVSGVNEDEDKRSGGQKPAVPKDTLERDTADVWDEHNSYKTHPHAILEGNPGPW